MVLLSLSIWSYMAGIIGLIIALPLTTIILAYYKRYILKEPDGMLNEAHEQSAASLAAEEA